MYYKQHTTSSKPVTVPDLSSCHTPDSFL